MKKQILLIDSNFTLWDQKLQDVPEFFIKNLKKKTIRETQTTILLLNV